MYPALHKLSEERSFCIGFGAKARDGFPFLAVSPGFERLTLFSRHQLLGNKCGDMLRTQLCNPPWIVEKVRSAMARVARKEAASADFLALNQRADGSIFLNFVRLGLLSSLSDSQDPTLDLAMIGFQIDAGRLVQDLGKDTYDSILAQLREEHSDPFLVVRGAASDQLNHFVHKALAAKAAGKRRRPPGPPLPWECEPFTR